MNYSVIFNPMLPWPVIAVLSGVMLLMLGLAIVRRLQGWPFRALAATVIVVALVNPGLQSEDRDALQDIALVIVDETQSQRLGTRTDQTEVALENLLAEFDRLDVEPRVARILDSTDDEGGTYVYEKLYELVTEVPQRRISGTFIISDGLIHDLTAAPALPAPTHVMLTGQASDWDRRLVIENAPSFAILDEEFMLSIRVEDMGAVPGTLPPEAELEITLNDDRPRIIRVPTNRTVSLPLTLTRGGRNVIQFDLTAQSDELTARNNAAVLQINGVRDRLRVLLVSGQPHPGQRTWRNLLKSDATVDLVHFTILRPPGKQDGVPVTELSLISFPTRELFLEKIEEFDLIIFDRYRRRGILSPIYLDSVRRYVEGGGALLVAAGPDFATADSLYRSPLSEVLPLSPTARVIEEAFLPKITDLGQRHPVTEGLEAFSPLQDAESPWGRWFRQVELTEKRRVEAQTLLSGYDDKPLLTLHRVAEGRVALLASDSVWLWDRGFEGGGPQLELLRRLAHWMMKEPELEEEALRVTAAGQEITVTRRTLGPDVDTLDIILPDGTSAAVELAESAPGQFSATFTAAEQGLYRFQDGAMESVFAVGPTAPKEFRETIASATALSALVDAQRGGVSVLEAGLPSLRLVREGRQAAGRGWLGLTPRGAYVTTDVRLIPLLPAWVILCLVLGLSVGAWLYEGRR